MLGNAPIRTNRLLLRRPHAGDVEALLARRNEPEVAAMQSWSLPFSPEQAEALVAAVAEADSLRNGEWGMLTVADDEDAVVLGDLAFCPTWEGRAVEIGFTMARSAWGHGYAVEAVEGLLTRLWASDRLTRVHAALHPDNIASAQVLERTGFTYEGRTRLSYWVGEDNTDDLLYGMTRDDLQSWRSRPQHSPTTVSLVAVTPDNAPAVRRLTTHHSQQRFVAPTLHSLADALIPGTKAGAPVAPWYRAIDADGELTGFVMLTQVTDAHPDPYLWRLLIDRRHQRRGVGAMALDLVIEECRGWGADRLLVSWCEGRGTPAPFYLARGFVPTGEVDEGGEVEAVLAIN
ncbi:hypothetical protein BH23ACT9_BH23ACT9_11630 [soil metagenome]